MTNSIHTHKKKAIILSVVRYRVTGVMFSSTSEVDVWEHNI
jgi:hypothetical protein